MKIPQVLTAKSKIISYLCSSCMLCLYLLILYLILFNFRCHLCFLSVIQTDYFQIKKKGKKPKYFLLQAFFLLYLSKNNFNMSILMFFHPSLPFKLTLIDLSYPVFHFYSFPSVYVYIFFISL